jgi:SAM-dependent methyltransferase
LLLEAERLGWRALGVEPGAAAAHMARTRGAQIIKGWFPADLPSNEREFEAICVLDVLEHFADPIGFLRQLRAHLKPGGRLLVQVPNWDSPLIRLQGAAGSTVCPGHWSYFTPETLVEVLSRANFRVIGLETVVSEIDRISAYPLDQIQEWVKRLRPEAPVWPMTTTELLDHALGYKLIGVFQA